MNRTHTHTHTDTRTDGDRDIQVQQGAKRLHTNGDGHGDRTESDNKKNLLSDFRDLEIDAMRNFALFQNDEHQGLQGEIINFRKQTGEISFENLTCNNTRLAPLTALAISAEPPVVDGHS